MPAGLDRIEPFPKVEMLSGNVGYVEIRLFAARAWAEDEAARVMAEVADADALIFDLRGNSGGTTHGMTSKGGNMPQWWIEGQLVHDLLWCNKSTQGHAPSKALGQAQDIWRHPVMF